MFKISIQLVEEYWEIASALEQPYLKDERLVLLILVSTAKFISRVTNYLNNAKYMLPSSSPYSIYLSTFMRSHTYFSWNKIFLEVQ